MKLFPITRKIDKKIAASHTPKDFKLDRKGYFLIKTDEKKKTIHAGFVNHKHILKTEINGRTAEEIYNTIIRKKLISSMQHAAYLGAELAKAEIALKKGEKYIQDKGMKY
jgi:tetrahydromethanopterin S-methyltransferase subunit A